MFNKILISIIIFMGGYIFFFESDKEELVSLKSTSVESAKIVNDPLVSKVVGSKIKKEKIEKKSNISPIKTISNKIEQISIQEQHLAYKMYRKNYNLTTNYKINKYLQNKSKQTQLNLGGVKSNLKTVKRQKEAKYKRQYDLVMLPNKNIKYQTYIKQNNVTKTRIKQMKSLQDKQRLIQQYSK